MLPGRVTSRSDRLGWKGQSEVATATRISRRKTSRSSATTISDPSMNARWVPGAEQRLGRGRVDDDSLHRGFLGAARGGRQGRGEAEQRNQEPGSRAGWDGRGRGRQRREWESGAAWACLAADRGPMRSLKGGLFRVKEGLC